MIVIGDVHGCYDTLMELLKKCPDDDICFVGDLIDRGPKSCDVVEFVRKNNHYCVLGNHEDMAVDATARKDKFYDADCWLYNGGVEGVKSYMDGVDGNLFREHIDWFQTLPLHLDFPDIVDENGRGLFVSHSGVMPYGNIENYDLQRWATRLALNYNDIVNSVVWFRGVPAKIENRFHVFGHTPRKNGPEIRSYYANVDTAVYSQVIGYGDLTAIVYPSMEIVQQRRIDEIKNG